MKTTLVVLGIVNLLIVTIVPQVCTALSVGSRLEARAIYEPNANRSDPPTDSEVRLERAIMEKLNGACGALMLTFGCEGILLLALGICMRRPLVVKPG